MLQPVGFFARTMPAKSWNHTDEKLQPALPVMEMVGYHVFCLMKPVYQTFFTMAFDFCYHHLRFLLQPCF